MNKIIFADVIDGLKQLPDGCVDTCVTSPPYFGLRDYGAIGQIGLEKTPKEYVDKIVSVFREVRRVIKDDGTVWLNIGDSYAGSGMGQKQNGCEDPKKNKIRGMKTETKMYTGFKAKDLIGIPWRVAFALQDDGWYLRQDIIWNKTNPIPEPVKDRCVKAHEYIFLLSKSRSYYFDYKAIKEKAVGGFKGASASFKREGSKRGAYGICPSSPVPTHRENREYVEYNADTRNKRSVWSIATKPYRGAHCATFPQAIITPCILAGAPKGGIVLDPFLGSGTTAAAAKSLGRQCIGIEINEEYRPLIAERLRNADIIPEQPSLI